MKRFLMSRLLMNSTGSRDCTMQVGKAMSLVNPEGEQNETANFDSG